MVVPSRGEPDSWAVAEWLNWVSDVTDAAVFSQKSSLSVRSHINDNKDIPHNMSQKDLIRATDFNFLMVLGKGSFGKVTGTDNGGGYTR